MAARKEEGIDSMIIFRTLVKVIKREMTPQIKTMAKASCQL
ncbi:hypothetical protein STRDD13_01562 [Streptococcus sp. DD13]|nr:hypothetical protein STRDD13_01562 [Streptococcus sp. DD13]